MTVEDKDDAYFVVIIPPPGPLGQKGPRKCEMAVESIDNKVAFGVVFDDRDGMSRAVHGVPLEPRFVRVGVDGSIQDDALVPVPMVGEIETVQQAIGSHLAWPKDMIIYTSTIGSEKNARNVCEVQSMHNAFNSVKPKDNVPPRFRLLYKFASTKMKESGNSIPVPCDFQIFGIERTIYLLHENKLELLEFKMIGQSAISTYMAYLYSVFRDTPNRDLSAMFVFLHPSTYKLNDDFNEYVLQRLKDGVLRMNFMPYNYNLHWILIVFWESEIFILNPLAHHPHPQDLEKTLMRAVRSYNAQEGRVNKNPKIKNLVAVDMKVEYIPPREDVILQNEAPDDVYIIMLGEVELIDHSEMDQKEEIVGILQLGDMFGEIGALCCRPQAVTYRTKTLSQLLKMKTSALIEAMQSKPEDYVAILKNFLQHHKRLKELNIGDLIVDSGNQEDDDPNMSINLLTVVGTGNAAFLDELLKARLDHDIGDSKGRTPLHIAASKGHEECVLLSRRNDVAVMKELLKYGLFVDSKDRHGLTPIQIAMEENHSEMVELLVMNGADVNTEDVIAMDKDNADKDNAESSSKKRTRASALYWTDAIVQARASVNGKFESVI
ncbi:hypothetical protein AgCh_035913 [Apium graveolens]